MKKLLIAALLALVSQNVFAGPFGKFNAVLDHSTKGQAQHYLDVLAKDLTPIMAGGSYGVGASLGAPSINVSLSGSYNDMSSDNKLVSDSSLTYPMLQVEVGLPAKIDLILRGSMAYDSTILGGGLRYQLLESSFIIIPTISVTGLYNNLSAKDSDNKFGMNNYIASATASFPNIPLITPFVNVTYTYSDLKAKSSIYDGTTASYSAPGYGIGAAFSFLMLTGSVSVNWLGDDSISYGFGLFAKI